MARAWLTDRKILAVTGQDRVSFLQGLVSNDVVAAKDDQIVWAGYLTPQGRYLSDFFIWHEPDRLLLDVPAAHAETLKAKLTRFRLRADVQITMTDLGVEALWGDDTATDALPDPRLPQAGTRRLGVAPAGHEPPPEQEDGQNARSLNARSLSAYHAHRIALGMPDASDCEREKTLLIEANFDWLNGISFTKGCYMGQELTARTHYRGLVKKRLLPVRSSAPLPPAGTPLMADGREVGQMGSSIGTMGLAFLRREVWTTPLHHEGATLTPLIPDWFRDETS